jgi:hypothetical protein
MPVNDNSVYAPATSTVYMPQHEGWVPEAKFASFVKAHGAHAPGHSAKLGLALAHKYSECYLQHTLGRIIGTLINTDSEMFPLSNPIKHLPGHRACQLLPLLRPVLIHSLSH